MGSRQREQRLVLFADPPYFGGAEGYVALLARGRPEGWHVSAVLPEGDGGAILADQIAETGAEVHRFTMRHPASPRLWFELGGLLRRIRGDALHMNLPSVYDARLTVPAVLAKSVGYRRVVTTEHLPMVDRARRRMLVKILLTPAVDAIIVNTEWNRQTLASKHHIPRRKIRVIPNASAEAPAMTAAEREAVRAELGIGRGEIAVVSVGRLTARKGHRFLQEALAGLDAPWRLLMAGEGEEDAALRAQSAELGIADRVHFLGHRTDARRVIHACDLLALASTLETQPFVLSEAMASGLPVVSTTIYGIPETVNDGETGYLVPPGEVAPLRAALSKLITDADLRERMGRAARARYESHFALEIMAARTYKIFDGREESA